MNKHLSGEKKGRGQKVITCKADESVLLFYKGRSDKEQTCDCHVGRRRGRKDWEFGISRCKLLYIGWINNKVLLYSTGSYTQYPMINHNGKEYEKECTYN